MADNSRDKARPLKDTLMQYGHKAAASVQENEGVGSLSAIPDPNKEAMKECASFLSACMYHAKPTAG